MPIIHIKEIKTSLLTLFGVSLVLCRRNAIVRLATPVLWLSPWLHNIWIFNFQFTSTFKIFVRSHRDWKERMPERIPTLPLFQSLRLCKPIATSCALWCIVMPTHWGGGNFLPGGKGRVESMKWWCGDDDEMISFLHSFYKGIFRELERNTHDLLLLLCFEIFAFTPFLFVRMLHLNSCISFLWAMKQTEEKCWQAWKKFWWKVFGAFWKCLRQTFALDEKIGGSENVCAKPLCLMKK
jgi:hypothetical protein